MTQLPIPPSYPEGNALQAQIHGRHRTGKTWYWLFLTATTLSVIVLLALLYNVLDSSFGLVAIQNEIEPQSLVRDYYNQQLLTSTNTTASEDDNQLVTALTADPYAIGFFGYAYYQQNQAHLTPLTINGIPPTADTATSGTYPLTRPLYLYSAAEIFATNPAASLFINYYLSHVDELITNIGYFPAAAANHAQAQDAWLLADGLELQPGQWATIDPAGATGTVKLAGSSTIYPLTQRLADEMTAAGYNGQITIENIGTTAGFRALCETLTTDIANASRPIQPAELDTCRQNGRLPVAFNVGTDALVIVVSKQNDFLTAVTTDQLQQIFTTAQNWSDVNPAWPNQPIHRFIPGADSGTLDFFSQTIFTQDLANLPYAALLGLLQANISPGLGRRLERDQRFYADQLIFEDPAIWAEICATADAPTGCTLPARSQRDLYELVLERVVAADIKATWPLTKSLFDRQAIAAEMAADHPNAHLEFRSWLTPDFLVSPQSGTPEFAGVRTAILGSLWVILLTVLISFPIGVGAAIYLEDYARDNWLNRLLQTNISNLAGVPSIIYGMLGLAIFVRTLEQLTSGALFGFVEDTTTANGRTILSAGLTLSLLILPVIIINAQEAIRAVPNSLRQASLGLGATRWQTIWHHVLPNALPGILTGTILAMSRAIGETAPLVVVGASTFITLDPTGPFSKFTVLPIQIYQWTSRPQDEFRNIAAAAIVVLLLLLLTLNATAVILRNRYSKQAA